MLLFWFLGVVPTLLFHSHGFTLMKHFPSTLSLKWAYSYPFLLMVPLILYGRKRLFSMINDLPTVFEVVTERKPVKDKPTVDSGRKSRGSTKLAHTQTWLAGLVLVILVHSRSLQGK
ncbi:hypothetical protein RJT34_09165 [Clitoria ternatea]|uniref:Alfin N-terminal domain-containing protein n=1 Tax=Clitoria ternatea TaxID=43366 RepID=A0AAN9K719_CLITE